MPCVFNGVVDMEIEIKKVSDFIPHGLYCYTYLTVDDECGDATIKKCPYWDFYTEKKFGKIAPEFNGEEDLLGYCHYLKDGDWGGTFLLWDQVKECCVNLEEE